MTPGGEAPTASSPDPVRALGQQLEQSGYLETSLPEALASDGPLATLAALFGLGVAVPRAAVPDVAALEAEGLLASEAEATALFARSERGKDGDCRQADGAV